MIITELASKSKTVEEIRQVLIEKFKSCDNQRLRYRIRKLGFVPISQGSGRLNRSIDFNPFMVKSDEVYYWIGYIAADGNIARNSNIISISSKDINHLRKIQSLYKNKGNEYYFVNKVGSNMLNIHFAHKETKDFLFTQYGLTPNKSKTLKLRILNASILRGIFDGDGPASKEVKVTTTSEILRESIMKFLYAESIESYYRKKGNSLDCYDIIIRPKSYVKFYNLLYKEATVYLERKQIAMWALIK